MLKLTVPTAKDRALFSRMVQLYVYDFTELNQGEIGSDGLFSYIKCFDEMWTDSNRYPRIFMVEAEPAGFGLVRQVSPGHFDMEQFFVLRKFRRSGIGKSAAHVLFRAFSGKWTVRQISTNYAAQAFWRAVIAEYTNGDFQETEGEGPMQSFVS